MKTKTTNNIALGYLITANFRALRVFPMQVLVSSCLPQQILNFSSNLFTHFDKKLKNSLELPNPTRNTRKFANKLMTDTSGEINLQSKVKVKVKSAYGPMCPTRPELIPVSVA